MEDHLRLTAISKLASCERTVVSSSRRDTLRNIAIKSLSKSASYSEMKLHNAIELNRLQKQAGWWGDTWHDIKNWEGWDTMRYLPGALADEFSSADTWNNIGLNTRSGVKSVGNGIVKGIAMTPGFFAGLGAGIGSFAKNLVTGKGIGGAWDQAWKTGGEAANWVNRLGPEGYDLEHLKRWADSNEAVNKQEYMERNGIDANNMSTLDKLSVGGLSLANASGEMIGASVAGGAITKGVGALGKGTVTVAGKLNNAKNMANTVNAARTTAQTAQAAQTAANTANAARTTAQTAQTAQTAANTANAARTTAQAAQTAQTAANATGAAANTAATTSRAAAIANNARATAGKALSTAGDVMQRGSRAATKLQVGNILSGAMTGGSAYSDYSDNNDRAVAHANGYGNKYNPNKNLSSINTADYIV